MPQAIAAAAAWVATAATAAAATIGVSTTMGSALAIYSSVQAVATVALSVGVQVGISALTSPKVGGAGGAGSQVDFQSNPDAGIPYAVGETGTAGVYVYNTVGEAKNRNLLFNTVLSLGPIDAFTGFKAVDEEVTFGSLQQAVGGTYANRMWQNRQLGLTPSPAFGPPNTTDAGVLAEWTANHKLSGLAASWYVLGYDQKTYASGAPAPMWKIRGVKAYDPRLDDTYPGGAGPQRWDDEATWAWSDNPWVHALTWCIGRTQNGRRVMGLGCALAGIDVAAFVEAANVADANGWKISGVVYSTDSKWEVLKAFCQAGGGRPIALGAKVSCLVNAPRVSIATLTGADIEGDPTITATQTRRSRVNAVVPRYRSEDHGWDIVAADPLVVDAYVAEDGGQRTQEIEYPLVPDVTQAAQLAAYAITNSREFGPNVIPVTPAKGWALKPGDCITIDEPELGIVGQKMLVVERERNLSTGGRILTCVSETDAKHDYCLGRVGTPPPTPGLSGVDPLPQAPEAGSWTAAAGFVGGEPDSRVPAIIVTGETDDPGASGVIVDYRLEDGEWSSVERPASVTNIAISPVASNATYEVRVRYRSMLGLEDGGVFLDLGSVTTGALVADDTKSFGGLTGDQIKAIDAAARKAQLDILDARMKALGDLKAFEAILRQVLSGKPLGEVIVEQRQVLINTNATVGENTAAIASEAVARQTAISAEAYQRTVLATDYSGFKASTSTSLVTLSTATSATAASLASVTTDYNGFKASASTTLISLSTATSATAASLTTLESTVAANKASADAGLLTVATDISALSTQYTSLNATVLANKASADSSLSVLTSNLSSTAASLTTLTSTFNSFQSSASTSLTTLSNAQSTQASQITALQSTAAGLSASVSSQASTLVDVTSKLAVARFVLEAAASGGRPVRVSLESDSYGGSNIALTAAKIYWGDNTVFDDATDTLRTVTGSTAAVLGLGSPFGASADLLWWIGPSGVSLGAMSRANAYFYIAGSSPYIGGAGLGAGKEVKNAGGGFSGYIGAGVGWNAAAYIGLNIDAGPGSFMVSVNGVATRDGISSANAMGAWRLTDGSTTLASGYVTAFQSDGLQGTAFSALKKVSTTLTGSVTLTLEFQGVGGGGGDTGTVSGDVFVQYVKD